MLSVYHGPPANEGDYVIIADQPINSTLSFYTAKVHNDKAYAAYFHRSTKGWKWLRKISNIACVIPESSVSENEKKLIEMNINAEDVYDVDFGTANVLKAVIQEEKRNK